ncbi:hypothetical protein JXB37_00430 [candidate division WOR-3 bacterium]|nr:hypothetical protein [candidate division WOR-3 bacterium]
MSVLLLVAVMLGGAGSWQSFTNTNFINDIARQGDRLALATNGGVVVLDQERLVVEQTVVNTDGLPANRCLAIALDDSGNVWVATDGGGLGVVSFDGEFVGSYRPNDMPARLFDLAWDGERLLAATEAGLYVMETRGTLLDFDDDDIRQFSVARYPGVMSDRVLSVFVGERYGVGTNVGVAFVDRGFQDWQTFRRPHGDSVKAIAEWGGELLVGTERGVAVLEDSTFTPVFQFAAPHAVYEIDVAWPELYVATDTGLFRACSLRSGEYQRVLGSDVRTVLVGDRIWAGLGAYELSGQGLRYSQTGQSWSSLAFACVASAYVSDVAFDEESGRAYLIHYTSNRAVTKVNVETGVVASFAGRRGLAIQAQCDSEGRAWFAHFAATGGLTAYNPATDSWIELKWGNESGWNIIDAFGIDERDNTKWVYNAQGLVVAIDSAGEQQVFEIPGLVPPPGGGYDFAFDKRGRAWLGLTVGLVEIDYGGTLHDPSDDRYAVRTAGLPSNEIRSVATGLDGFVWVATPQGAAKWDGTRFRVYDDDNSGILSDNIYRVRVDASGRVWLLCDIGLSVFDPVSERWSNYTPYNSGLIANHEGITGFYTSLEIDRRRGVCAIGTQRGLSLFRFGSDSAAVSGASIKVYPNPCVLGTHTRIVIDSLPESARVEVRALTGRPVAELEVDEGLHRAVWEPGGVAGGLYLVVVIGPGGRRVERVAVVRD